ncbi:MAG: cohesin domain-containing protein [Dehalococcoidia bacterium]
MRIRPFAPLLLFSAPALIAAVLLYAATSAAPAPINRVAVDANSSGNSATAIGATQICVSMSNGASTTIDVIVDSVPPFSSNEGGIAGFNFILHYDPARLKVTAYDNEMLLDAGGGTNPFDFTNVVPDTDGNFVVGFADFGSNIENGAGVLSRITLEAIGAGTSPLTLTDVALTDGNTSAPNTYVVQNILGGEISIDTACSMGSPPATFSPSPTPSATATVTPTPTPTPVGQTPSPTPTATPVGQTPSPSPSEPATVKGDADCSGVVLGPDALAILLNAALGTPLPCPNAADVTCNGLVNLGDMILILSSLGGTATLPTTCA